MLQANPVGGVGFYAVLSTTEQNPGKHHTIIFDSVTTNVGTAYNGNSGVFTAPNPGIYSFSWSIAVICHSYAATELVVNSDAIGFIETDGETDCEHKLSTGNVVVDLHTGDIVLVRTNSQYPIKGSILRGPHTRGIWKVLHIRALCRSECHYIQLNYTKDVIYPSLSSTH